MITVKARTLDITMVDVQTKIKHSEQNELPFILRNLINSTDMDLARFCKHINVGYATIYQILIGNNQSPRIETLLPVAKYFNISLEQLIGEKPMNQPKQSSSRKRTIVKNADQENAIWHNKLFSDCTYVVSEVLKEYDAKISIDEFMKTVKEVYMYSIAQKLNTADKGFTTWYCSQYYK